MSKALFHAMYGNPADVELVLAVRERLPTYVVQTQRTEDHCLIVTRLERTTNDTK